MLSCKCSLSKLTHLHSPCRAARQHGLPVRSAQGAGAHRGRGHERRRGAKQTQRGRFCARFAFPLLHVATDVATCNVCRQVTVAPTATLQEAAQLMLRKKVRTQRRMLIAACVQSSHARPLPLRAGEPPAGAVLRGRAGGRADALRRRGGARLLRLRQPRLKLTLSAWQLNGHTAHVCVCVSVALCRAACPRACARKAICPCPPFPPLSPPFPFSLLEALRDHPVGRLARHLGGAHGAPVGRQARPAALGVTFHHRATRVVVRARVQVLEQLVQRRIA